MNYGILLAEVDGSLSGRFTAIDWAVLIGYLAMVSVLGIRLAGKQRNMEDFFRGRGGLPWYAVSASMIATIISAVTFVAVPSRAYADGGNFSYLQLGIVAGLISRLFVAFVLVPAYFRYEVYSPYDYMGARLGEAARSVSTVMFTIMGLMAQAARVYLTALVLTLVLKDPLAVLTEVTGIGPLVWAVGLVGVIAVIWTMMGGIATVVWTDAMLFLIFVIGGIVAISVISAQVTGGLTAVVSQGWEAGKFQLFTLGSTSDVHYATWWGSVFAEPFTIWAAFFAVSFGNIGAYGTDQLLAQRIFTCRSKRDAQLAVVTSWAAEGVAALMLLVGVGLWAFYREFPGGLAGDAADAVAANRDNIFPVFILTQVPVAMRGLIVAGIFAAAISSLTSILAALAQTSVSAVYLPLRKLNAQEATDEHQREILRVSRMLIAAWGIVLCAVALAIDAYVRGQEAAGRPIFFLDLALGLASYVLGTLFAAFLLAWLPLKKDAYGLIWSAPMSVACVLASRFQDKFTVNVFGVPVSWPILVSVVLLSSWILAAVLRQDRQRTVALLLKTVWLLAGCCVLVLIARNLWFGQIDPESGNLLTEANGEIARTPIAWPWYAPIGGLVAFVFGYLLGEPRSGESD